MMTTSVKSILAVYIVSLLQLHDIMVSAECIVSSKAGPQSKEILKKLKPIEGKVFSFSFTDESDRDKYTYNFAICSDVTDQGTHAGVVQKDLTSGKIKVVGRTNNVTVKAGTDWIMLTYKSGDKYGSHCNNEARQAHLMIMCNAYLEAGNFAVLYEENGAESSSDCYYLMEMESKVACTNLNEGLSTGSILLIVFSCLIFAYLSVGMIYNRCVHGSKGFEQVPNSGFWRACGNLQADGCDFICRCQGSGFHSSRPYRGIADDQLDDEADDENLLPM